MSVDEEEQEEAGLETSEEYELMRTMEQLESLEEELQEVGFGTLGEVEATLSSAASDSTTQNEKLIDIRDQMIELNVTNLREIRDHISRLNEELDERDAL